MFKIIMGDLNILVMILSINAWKRCLKKYYAT